jgi:hypothetical protein
VKRPVFPTALVLTLLLLAAACEQSAGTGPTASITLGTAADLAKIGADPAYPVDGDYTLGADLTLENWTPIGSSDAPFAGAFNGNDRTLTINNGSGGLFGFTDGAVISNVTVAGTISAAGNGTVQAGGIVGNAENTVISFCVSSVDVTVEGHGHNSSAGGIAGYMLNNSVVVNCSAGGTVILRSGETGGLMLYAGGIAGYQGTGLVAAGSSGCVISRSYFTGSVVVEGGYPYAGGIAGYNYCGSVIRECYSTNGSVTARGANLPYAGGISGYNSMTPANPAVIENCYSSMTVSALATSKQALAGGISGANAGEALISKCYATGAVYATVDGIGAADAGGSIGPPASANAGGIAGAQYFNAPSIRNCVALNTTIAGVDSGSGAAYNVHRIAGPGDTGQGVKGPGDCVWENNIANASLAAGGNAVPPEPDSNGYDGETCAAKPDQTAYEELGWNFSAVWKMSGDGYPVLQGQ